MRNLELIPANDPIVTLVIASTGTIGVDNVGVQSIPVPGWIVSPWSGDVPSIQEQGPEGNYVHLPTGDGANAFTKVEIPTGVKSLAYWFRVSDGGSGAIHVMVSNGEEGEDEDFAMLTTDLFESGDDEWIKRVVDLTQCPPRYLEEEGEFEGDCEVLHLDIQAWSGYLDFSLSSSSDSDMDEDGIYDDWEEYGVLTEGPGSEDSNFIDLPAMGADPEKPDIFIHLDYLQGENDSPVGGDQSEYDQELYEDALEVVVSAFADSPYVSPTQSVGINLHIDQGPGSTLDFSEESTWGALSKAGPIDPDDFEGGVFDSVTDALGTFDGPEIAENYVWDEFDAIKADRFTPTGRSKIFHYAIAWYRYGSASFDSSGIAGIGGQDFIISLGGFTNEKGTWQQQAGTLMHELGHNLGLDHGGHDGVNYKPNYLSVMNFSFQFGGTIQDTGSGYDSGFYDYSRDELDDLNEEFLIEANGLGSEAEGYGTIYYCGPDEFYREEVNGDASDPIDWNCDESISCCPTSSINADETDELLEGSNDWASIILVGGEIGGPGSPTQELWLLKQARLAKIGEHSEIGFREAEEKGLLDFASSSKRSIFDEKTR